MLSGFKLYPRWVPLIPVLVRLKVVPRLRHIKHLQNNLSSSRSQGITKQKRPAIYDKASLRKDICKRFTENLHEFQVVTRSKQTKKYLEFWEVRKWFLLTCTRAEDRGCK